MWKVEIKKGVIWYWLILFCLKLTEINDQISMIISPDKANIYKKDNTKKTVFTSCKEKQMTLYAFNEALFNIIWSLPICEGRPLLL